VLQNFINKQTIQTGQGTLDICERVKSTIALW